MENEKVLINMGRCTNLEGEIWAKRLGSDIDFIGKKDVKCKYLHFAVNSGCSRTKK